ncbi:MAG: sensor histidine kinase [Lachnospiraceae bacterium]|nr:sensor histidine kinase [Lachnospiraceae bacterium]
MRQLRIKIQHSFNNLSIRNKLLILLTVAGIIPLVFVSLFSITEMYQQSTRQAYENLDASAQQISQNIDSMLVPVEQVSSILYTNSQLNSFIAEQYKTDYEYVEAYRSIENLIGNFLIANSDIDHICCYVSNETIWADGRYIFSIEEFNNSTQIGTSLDLYESSFFSETSKKGQYYLNFFRALDYTNRGSTDDYLVISVRENTLSQLYALSGEDSHIYVTDVSGMILSSLDKNCIAENIHEIISEQEINIGQLQKCRIGDEMCFFVSSSLSNGWNVIVALPAKSIYSGIGASLRWMILISVFCLTAALFLTLYITRYFCSRLSLLTQQVELIEHNDFSFFIKTDGTDELGRLGTSVNKMAHALDTAINEVAKKEIELKEADLRLLQSQINPHFLYNALSTISTMAMNSNDTKASEFATHLSQFYKLSLNNGKKILTLRDEIKITEHYISIQLSRFQDQFSFDWSVDPSVLDCTIPKLVLQPFIENIINHSVRQNGAPVHTEISIQQDNSRLKITICDNGCGISPEVLDRITNPEDNHGYGLKNVNARLKLYFGDEYGIQFDSQINVGTTAIISVKKKMQSTDGFSALFHI